jgi:molecular chaperone DnaK (HSP70)
LIALPPASPLLAANGIVHVSAKDKATNKQQSITIQSSGGLSDTQIEKMVKDAEQYAAKDAQRKAAIEAKNEADSLIYSAEKSLAEYRDRLPQNVIDEINNAVTDLRGVMESEEPEDIKAKINGLQQSVMKIGSSLSGQGGSSEGGENVQDAEVKDKKE